jgi:hypothetical protein
MRFHKSSHFITKKKPLQQSSLKKGFGLRIGFLILNHYNDYRTSFPIALPILYTISKATSVGTKPTARNIPASPGS